MRQWQEISVGHYQNRSIIAHTYHLTCDVIFVQNDEIEYFSGRQF